MRVVQTIGRWGREQDYFASEEDASAFQDELTALLILQKASFNSPVWFNVGIEETPQCSTCFILSVDDTMESILRWYAGRGDDIQGRFRFRGEFVEAPVFKGALVGWRHASGPISFMKAADASAGVIKSGGKTRRAAKMVMLDCDHPDVMEFVRSKAEEEKKAQALIRAGFDPSSPTGAYGTVAFQNSNHSVRLTDEFMEAEQAGRPWQTRFVLDGTPAETFPSRDLLHEIAAAAHVCGDPGVQFHTTINSWHTCPNTGPVRGSNPCSEYMHVDDSACNLASLRLTAFLDEQGFQVDQFFHAVEVMITAQEILVDLGLISEPENCQELGRLEGVGAGFRRFGGHVDVPGVAL